MWPKTFRRSPGSGVTEQAQFAGRRQRGAFLPDLNYLRCCRGGQDRLPRFVQPAPARPGRRSRLRAESLRPELMWMWALLAMSTVAAGRIGLRRRIASQPARVHGPPGEHEAGKPHHARSVSMSRSTCTASARSASSAASSSASASRAAAAFRRAASMSAARTAADTGVPSLVKTASARDASSSGRKVIVSATETECTTKCKTVVLVRPRRRRICSNRV
jgi:hypothetical protein